MTEQHRDLVIAPCQSACTWSETGDVLRGETVFGCGACGSEWVPSEAWTPVDYQGHVPDAVQAQRERQRRSGT